MPRRVLILLLLLALSAAACQAGPPQTGPIKTASPAASTAVGAYASQTPESAPGKQATPTEAPQPTTAVVQAGVQVPIGCTVVSPEPTLGPTEQSLFPPPGEKDWTLGPADARFTIIEYSDFM